MQTQHSSQIMSSEVIRDIQHGEKYREVGSFLSHLGNLTLLMNTDGVQIFKSSSVSIWPIWVVINELVVICIILYLDFLKMKNEN